MPEETQKPKMDAKTAIGILVVMILIVAVYSLVRINETNNRIDTMYAQDVLFENYTLNNFQAISDALNGFGTYKTNTDWNLVTLWKTTYFDNASSQIISDYVKQNNISFNCVAGLDSFALFSYNNEKNSITYHYLTNTNGRIGVELKPSNIANPVDCSIQNQTSGFYQVADCRHVCDVQLNSTGVTV